MEDLDEIRKKKMEELSNKYSDEENQDILDKPIEITDDTFDEVIQKYKLTIIDCWAEWCGPCRMVGPIIDELAKDYSGKIVFGKLNVDQNRSIPMKYQIMSIPTLLIFKEGNLVDKIIGALPKPQLVSKINQYL